MGYKLKGERSSAYERRRQRQYEISLWPDEERKNLESESSPSMWVMLVLGLCFFLVSLAAFLVAAAGVAAKFLGL